MINPLFDEDVDGNTMNLNPDDGIPVEDQYKCDRCGCVVGAALWHFGELCCMSCFLEDKL